MAKRTTIIERRETGPTAERLEEEIQFKHIGAHNELLATVWLLRHGYDVFRNVSAHGPVDLIAIKGGVPLYLDAKQVGYRAGGVEGRVRITREQAALGVKIIRVFPDGNCSIDENPPVVGESLFAPRVCEECSTEYTPAQGGRYCRDACRQAATKRKSKEAYRAKMVGEENASI